jgi:hypothetical protein
MDQLLTVSLRQRAIYIPGAAITNTGLKKTTALLVANLAKLGFGITESLLKALNLTAPDFQTEILDTCREALGVKNNWTPLVKGWDMPTGESVNDHVRTLWANLFKSKGHTLPCGDIIPENTFPLHRYNGCPFCGTPFEQGQLKYYKQGSHQKVLELWTEKDIVAFLEDLLTSKTALDATQIDSLKILLSFFPVPDVKIGMKETLMAVIDLFIKEGQSSKAQSLFTSPVDILRYLWYKHTGFLQLIEPKTIVRTHIKNNRGRRFGQIVNQEAQKKVKPSLKLKYNRKECLMVAGWLNNLPMEVAKICEAMHPKRAMWVRFIRALRLAEYSKRKGFEKLNQVMDMFYKEEYAVWQGQVAQYRLRYDAANTFSLLQQRPGLFARSLFANMLWFGKDETINAFSAIIDKVPARLVFTLEMYAATYFDPAGNRSVKPLGGTNKRIPNNQLLSMYVEDDLQAMHAAVATLCTLAVEKRFAAIENPNITIYIDPALFNIPLAIGDRSDNLQDLPGALMGTRFAVDGDKVRLFMQWGAGLPAQHLDMDLSCQIAYPGYTDYCSYSRLNPIGCKHSGDIIHIPHQTGTAEYIEIDLQELQKVGAKYVSFTCNAFSNGSITPNLVVGWMNSKYPMKVSNNTGVAYDPSCVQHQVRVVNPLTKGLLFGVLDVKQREIIWLEMSFQGQVVQNLDTLNVEALLRKLKSKITIGLLLQAKAYAQCLELADKEEADEVYTKEWALNTAAVTKLLVS